MESNAAVRSSGRCWVPVPAAVLAASIVVSTATAGVIAGNGVRLEYRVDPELGLRLERLGDERSPGAFSLQPADVTGAPADLWVVTLRHVATGETTPVHPSQPDTVFTFELDERPDGLTARWLDVACDNLPGVRLLVEVEAQIPDDGPLVELSIRVVPSAPDHSLYRVEFPRVRVGLLGGGTNEVLTFPWIGGWLLRDPARNIYLTSDAPIIHPGFVSMQWWAYYDSARSGDRPVLFWGTRDRTGHHKEYQLGPVPADIGETPTGLSLRVRQFPSWDLVAGVEYSSPYPTVIGMVRGDWYDAARLYRGWAVLQPWTDQGPMRARLDLSPFMESRVFTNWSGDEQSFQYWPRDMADQQALFVTGPLPAFVFNWHSKPMGIDWGDWFPIKPEYVDAANQVAANGHGVVPYFNNEIYNMNLPSFDQPYVPGYEGRSVGEFVIIGEDGQPVTELDDAGNPVAWIDHSTPFSADYSIHVAERLRDDTGARGIYFDVFTNGVSTLCYAEDHGHPPGGGDYFTQGKIETARQTRDTLRASDPDFILYSESENELYLGVVDQTWAHATGDTSEALGMAIAPLFQTVYHDFQVVDRVDPIHGPLAMLSPGRVKIMRRIYAADIFFGHNPFGGSILAPNSIHDTLAQVPTYDELLDMIQRYTALLAEPVVRRRVALGERLRDPVADAETIAVMTDPPTGVVDAFLPYSERQPVVYASAWRDPPEAALGVLLLNWTDGEDQLPDNVAGGGKTVTFSVDTAQAGLAPGDHSIYEMTTGGAQPVRAVQIEDSWTEEAPVAERSARFLLLAPAPRLDPIAPVAVMAGELLEIRLTGALVDGAPYVFTSPALPPGATLDPETGVFAWRTELAQVGVWTVILAVEDGLYTHQQSAIITVTSAGEIFSDGFESGDVSAWRAAD